MLSVETEARVAKLLLSLAEGESSVEISRQVLSDNYDFDPYQIFRALDTECKNKVNSCNILNFLRCKGIFANEAEVNFLIQCYDQDGDGCLSYSEFLNLIQSEKSLRKNYSNSCDNKLSFNIEYSLGKLLEKEIDLSRNIMNLLNDLRCRCDYNTCDIFNSLKSYNSITPESLKCFLDKNCASYLDSDIKAMMKRMDTNSDGRVDLYELTKLLEFPTCVPICCDPCPPKCCPPISCCPPKCCPPVVCCPPKCLPVRCCSPCPSPRRCFSSNNSPIRGDLSRKTENILNNSGMYNTQNTTYLTNANSPLRNSPRDNCSPMRISNNLSLRLSPQRKCPPCSICCCDPCCCRPICCPPICCSPNRVSSPMRMNSPNRMNSPMRMNSPLRNNNSNYNLCNPNEMEERQLNDYFKSLMDAESQIEKAKTDLALKCDFNCEDAFRIFECNCSGCISPQDLKCGLRLLDIYASDSDIRNLMKRFDLSGKGYLNYADFFDMVVPYEKDFREMVENRCPNNCCPSNNPDVFMFSTKLYLKNLFNSLIDYENKLNCMKRGYTTLRLRLRDIFKNLDQCCLGSFDNNDLQCYLQKNCLLGNPKDADLLFIRLDKNRNGKVDYCELEDELQPQY